MVESTQMDLSYGIYNLNSPLMIQQKDPDQEFRLQTQQAFLDSKYVMVNGVKTSRKFEQQIQDYLGAQLPSGFRWIDHFQDWNTINSLEVTNKYGYMFMIYGSFMFIFNGSQIAEIFDQGKTLMEVKPNYYKAVGILHLVRVSEKNEDKFVAIQEDKEVKFFDIKNIVTSLKKQAEKLPEPISNFQLRSGDYLRQVSFGFGPTSHSKVLMVTDTYDLYHFDIFTKQFQTYNDVTSAVFNQTGSLILASFIFLENHIKVLEPNNQGFTVKNTIHLTFSEYCSFDRYKVVYLSDYFGENLMIGVTGFQDQGQIDLNFGYLMSFWVGKNITEQTTLQELKDQRKIKYYFYNDQQHNNDFNPPTFKLHYVNPYQSEQLKNDYIGILGVSQCAEPLTFKIQNGDISCFFDFKNYKFTISFPRGFNPQDNFGIYQGVSLVKFKIPQLPQLYSLDMKDCIVELKFPPFLMQLGIDGDIQEAMVIYAPFKDEELLYIPQDINLATTNSIQPSIQNVQNRVQEESKEEQKQSTLVQQTKPIQKEEEKKQPPAQIETQKGIGAPSTVMFGQQKPEEQKQGQSNPGSQTSNLLDKSQSQSNQNSNTHVQPQAKPLTQPLSNAYVQAQQNPLVQPQQNSLVQAVSKPVTQQVPQSNSNISSTQSVFGQPVSTIANKIPVQSNTVTNQIGQTNFGSANLFAAKQEENKSVIGGQGVNIGGSANKNFSSASLFDNQAKTDKKEPQFGLSTLQTSLDSTNQINSTRQQNNQTSNNNFGGQNISNNIQNKVASNEEVKSQQQQQIYQQIRPHQQPKQTPINIVASRYDQDLCQTYNKTVVALLQDIQSKLPTIEQLSLEFKNNNIDTSYFTNNLQVKNQQIGLNLDETRAEISKNIDQLKSNALKVNQFKEELHKAKIELQTLQFNDDLRKNLSAGSLKQLLIFREFNNNNAGGLSNEQKSNIIAVEDRASKIFDKIDEACFKGQQFSQDQSTLDRILQTQRALQLQQCNKLTQSTSKYLVGQQRQLLSQPTLSPQTQLLQQQNMTRDIMEAKKRAIMTQVIQTRSKQQICRQLQEEKLYNQGPSDMDNHAGYYYGNVYGSSQSKKPKLNKYDFNEENLIEEPETQKEEIHLQPSRELQLKKENLMRKMQNRDLWSKIASDFEQNFDEDSVQQIVLQTPTSINQYLQKMQQMVKPQDNKRLLQNGLDQILLQNPANQSIQQTQIQQQPRSQSQQQQQPFQTQPQIQSSNQSPSNMSPSQKQAPQKKPSMQIVNSFMSNQFLPSVEEHEDEHNDMPTPTMMKKKQGPTPSYGGFQANIMPQAQKEETKINNAVLNNFGDANKPGLTQNQNLNLFGSATSNKPDQEKASQIENQKPASSLFQTKPKEEEKKEDLNKKSLSINLGTNGQEAQQKGLEDKQKQLNADLDSKILKDGASSTSLFSSETSLNLGGLNLGKRQADDTKPNEEEKDNKKSTTVAAGQLNINSLQSDAQKDAQVKSSQEQKDKQPIDDSKPKTQAPTTGKVFGQGTSLSQGFGQNQLGATEAPKPSTTTPAKVFGSGTSITPSSGMTFSGFSAQNQQQQQPSQATEQLNANQSAFPKPQTQATGLPTGLASGGSSGSLFAQNKPLFSSSTPLFGQQNNPLGGTGPQNAPQIGFGGNFGQQQQQPVQNSGGIFGGNSAPFGVAPSTFGQQQQPGVFGGGGMGFGQPGQFNQNFGGNMMNSQGGDSFLNQTSNDFGTNLQGGNIGFASNSGPNFQAAKTTFSDQKFLKARK
eukprot:403376902